MINTTAAKLGKYINLPVSEVDAYIENHPTITSPITLEDSTPQISI